MTARVRKTQARQVEDKRENRYVIKVMRDKERESRVPLVRENQRPNLTSLLVDIKSTLVINMAYHAACKYRFKSEYR
jgi:hypothetical protein